MGLEATDTEAAEDAASKTVRDRLIDAAESCLRDKGIRATTVSEVAEAAGVSRGWLYRHFPDKVALLGAAIVRLNDAYWGEAHDTLAGVDGLVRQLTAGITLGRSAYDSPGALLMRLRRDEPEEFAACAGAGVQGLLPDLATFWRPYLEAAQDRGEIRVENMHEASEWLARTVLSVTTVPGDTLDPDDPETLVSYLERYLMPSLRPAGAP